MDFLKSLDQDIIVHRIGLYSVKRYKYTQFNWVDQDGKKVTERVFSFILMRGEKWFNDTSLNFYESELDKVIGSYEAIVEKKTQERRVKLSKEREVRKQFPVRHEFKFNNVVVTAIELPCYYYNGIPSRSGSYFEPSEKIVEFYANGFPYLKTAHTKIDTVIDTEFVLENTITNHIQFNYDKNEFTDTYANFYSHKLDFDYIPLTYIIGYVYNIGGKELAFTDYSWGNLETSEGKFELSLTEFMQNAKLVGELQGMSAWSALLNKTKFVY
jgi:hypothetical protein